MLFVITLNRLSAVIIGTKVEDAPPLKASITDSPKSVPLKLIGRGKENVKNEAKQKEER